MVGLVRLLAGDGRPLDPYPWRRGIDGEIQVARILEQLESEGYGIELHVDIGYGDVDLVVVGPTGVFAVEVKNWSGTVRLLDGTLRRNGTDASASVRQASRGAIAIRDRIGVSWVDAILVVPNGMVVAAPVDLGKVVVVDSEALVPVITAGRRRLSPSRVSEVLALLNRTDLAVGR